MIINPLTEAIRLRQQIHAKIEEKSLRFEETLRCMTKRKMNRLYPHLIVVKSYFSNYTSNKVRITNIRW